MKRLIFFLLIVAVLALPMTACGTQSSDKSYELGFQEGYAKGWQEGYEEGAKRTPLQPSTQMPSPTPVPVPSPTPSPIPSPAPLKKITLSDAPQVLDLVSMLPATFVQVDAASEGMSNADLGLGDDFSEVQLFISPEPFQMIYGIMAISSSYIERASFDAVMNDETMISNLLIENVRAGAIEEGMELADIDINITYPNLGDSAFLGEGYMSVTGLTAGFDALWFRNNKVYITLYSVYYTTERQLLLPIGEEIERRVSQYSQ